MLEGPVLDFPNFLGTIYLFLKLQNNRKNFRRFFKSHTGREEYSL